MVVTAEKGNIIYNQEVIGNIVGMATMECYGIIGMASKNASDGLWELIKGESLSKGVKITSKENELNIEVFIIVEYGTKISVIANNVIQKIKYSLENLTGLKVSTITVNVQGVRI